MSDRAWVATMVGDPAIPYADRHGASYEYDSKVQNHKRVAIGDLLFVKNLQSLRGVGCIANITESDGVKQRARCPICAASATARTIGGQEKFRCARGHVVDDPNIEEIEVRKFRADFDGQWVELVQPLPLIEVRKFYIQRSIRMSIIEAERQGLVDYVGRWEPQFAAAFPRWGARLAIQGDAVDNVEIEDDAPLALDDMRASALRAIKVRRGQPEFRQRMLQLFSSRCAISGCSVPGVLEAAHIKPYRGVADHDASNGILLRADLHTLFDLDLLGICPDTLSVHFNDALRGSEYAALERTIVASPRGSLSRASLRWRWRAFEAARR